MLKFLKNFQNYNLIKYNKIRLNYKINNVLTFNYILKNSVDNSITFEKL